MQKKYYHCLACNAIALAVDAIPPATHRCGGQFEPIDESEVPVELRPNSPANTNGVFYSG